MIEGLIAAGAAIVVGFLALLGTIYTSKKSTQALNDSIQQKLQTHQEITDYKIDELTREVRLHNNFAQRIPVLEEQMKVANHRIEDLEKH